MTRKLSVTTDTHIKQLVEEKTIPKNRDEQGIAGYRDVLDIIHESFGAIPMDILRFCSHLLLRMRHRSSWIGSARNTTKLSVILSLNCSSSAGFLLCRLASGLSLVDVHRKVQDGFAFFQIAGNS